MIDTSCLLRYLIRPGKAIKELIEVWFLEDRIRLVTSPELLGELESVLSRNRIRELIHPDEGAALLDAIRYKAEILPPLGDIPSYSRDPKDDKFVACAIAGRVADLITVDRDLLELSTVGSVKVVHPHVFIAPLVKPGSRVDHRALYLVSKSTIDAMGKGAKMTGIESGGKGQLSSQQEQKVLARTAQLLACDGDYGPLDAEQAARRLTWWDHNKDRLRLSGPLPRQAYTLFLIMYLGLEPDEVPVVYEDDFKITWRSFNFCPTLEACQRLGLDSREVCRAGTERSVQELISRLDPRLRFSRNYADGIRPYAPYCEESIDLIPYRASGQMNHEHENLSFIRLLTLTEVVGNLTMPGR